MMPADLTYYTQLLLPPHMWLSCHPLVLPTSGKNPNTDSLITMFTAQSLDTGQEHGLAWLSLRYKIEGGWFQASKRSQVERVAAFCPSLTLRLNRPPQLLLAFCQVAPFRVLRVTQDHHNLCLRIPKS